MIGSKSKKNSESLIKSITFIPTKKIEEPRFAGKKSQHVKQKRSFDRNHIKLGWTILSN